MQRIDENRVLIETPQHPITLFANEDVYVDRASVAEIEQFARVIDTIGKLKEVGYLGPDAAIEKIILTPDFHKGAGIPIGTVFQSSGFVIPRAVGSDIGCGMRFMTTDVTRAEFDGLGERLDQIIRHIYFEGGRNIPLSAKQREYIFRGGIYGLMQTPHSDEGLWEYWDGGSDRMNMHNFGMFHTQNVFPMEDFIRGSGAEYTRDDQIGSIGGGNHFVEVQEIAETYNRHKAYDWNIKSGFMGIMVHSGSVGIGHQIGNHFTDKARDMYPEGLRHDNNHYMLPESQTILSDYLSAMGNAANFAFANRMFLGLMMVRALSEALDRRVKTELVYDAPHNLVWDEDGKFVHRKGACPADEDEPVIIPGSMGSSSFLLLGQGSSESICSTCHGAGRARPRQQGRAQHGENTCRVITKVDPRMLPRRIQDEYARSLAEEAPDKYKDIGPVIATVEGAGLAQRVARMEPLLTVKGL